MNKNIHVYARIYQLIKAYCKGVITLIEYQRELHINVEILRRGYE